MAGIPPRILKVFIYQILTYLYRKHKDLPKNQVIIYSSRIITSFKLIRTKYLTKLSIVVGIYAEPSENNHRHFFVKIAGPEGTAYEGGMF